MGYSNEFKVGLLALVAILGAIWAVLRTDDRPDGALDGYVIYGVFPSAEGVWPASPVKIAGVTVGSVRKIALEGNEARLRLELAGQIKLGEDSYAELKSEGMLGDRFVRITPGVSDKLLPPGATISTRTDQASLEELQAKLGGIADDVKAVTAALREVAEDGKTTANVQETADNVAAITAEVRGWTESNRAMLDEVVVNLRDVSRSLERVVEKTGSDVDGELAAIREATAKLDRSLANIESITGRIDQGEGTLGALINDEATVNQLNETLANVNDTVLDIQDTVGSLTGMRTEVYYRGDYFFGTDPDEPGFTENPIAGGNKNIIGVRLKPREDFWYIFEFVDHPTGVIDSTEFTYDDGRTYTEYTRKPNYRMTFQFAKRYQDLVLRLGIKESGGGIGVDYLLARDRLMFSLDAYDWLFGSWPVLDDTPRVDLRARVTPYPHLFIEGGIDNGLLGLRHGFFTGMVGAGFQFDDDDFKWLLATLPISP